MRSVLRTNNFKKDLRREARGRYRKILDKELWEVVDIIANDGLLSLSYHDHALIGQWEGCRECHLAFDLVLIYRLVGQNTLILVRLGTHSEALGL